MNICVIGCGYVGLVTGTVFADLGNDVICVDLDQDKIDKLNKGKMPIYEPGLEEMVLRNVKDGRVEFTMDLNHGVQNSDIIFICVNTPPKDNGETDLSYVRDAATSIAKSMNSYKIIVNKSTVPVGTGNMVRH
ncbi:2-dehydropantoate 2-reductase N-terminal domain-containing protein, partial [Acidobacteriota bacterium]